MFLLGHILRDLAVKPRVWNTLSKTEVAVGTMSDSGKLVLSISLSVGVTVVYQ